MADVPVHDGRDVHIVNPTDTTKKVTTTTDGGKERLDVDAAFSGTISTDVRSAKQKASDDGELFTVSSDQLSLTGTTEVDLFLMKNPSGSGINFKWDTLRFWLNEEDQTTIVIRTYHGSTITSNGTALAEFDENAVTGNTAKIEWFHNPNISSRGTFRQAFVFATRQSLIHEFALAHLMKSNTNMVITAQSTNSCPVDLIMTNWWQEKAE